MTTEAMFVDVVLRNWKQSEERITKFFSGQTEDQFQREIAPGRNRLVYLFGHLAAVNDALLPLLGFGPRLHPELDEMFLKNPDRAIASVLTGEEVMRCWTKISEVLGAHLSAMTPEQWLEKHSAVTTEDFAKEPHRNRLNVVLSRIGHMAQHHGQASLAITKA